MTDSEPWRGAEVEVVSEPHQLWSFSLLIESRDTSTADPTASDRAWPGQREHEHAVDAMQHGGGGVGLSLPLQHSRSTHLLPSGRL